MKLFPLVILICLISLPGISFSQPPVSITTTDNVSTQLVSYYDLRDRESFVQVSNVTSNELVIHIQIFRNNIPGCPEINFYDELTPNDTHVYNMRDIKGNSSPVTVTLEEDGNGIVVITQVEGIGGPAVSFKDRSLIGNFRIIDSPGNFEYRSNSAGFTLRPAIFVPAVLTFNFNQIGNSNMSDVVGIEIERTGEGFTSVDLDYLEVFPFIYNDAENPTSCDFFIFGCGGEVVSENIVGEGDYLNVGINNIFPGSKSEELLCGGNADTTGFVQLISDEQNIESDDMIVGFTGLNNGNGTGSMDSWVSNPLISICEFLPNSAEFNQCGF